MTTQLTLSGTPEELADILNAILKTNGISDLPPVVEMKTVEKPKKRSTKTEPETIPELPLGDSEETTEEVSIEDIRSLVQTKSKAGKREEIKKLLKNYGAASVTELDEENYGEFKLKLEKL